MKSKLVDHLARCDTASLKPLLGDATFNLLERVGGDALNSEGLSYLIVSMHGDVGALRSRAIRDLIFSKLSSDEGRALCELLQLPASAALMTLRSVDFDSNPLNLEMLIRWFGVSYDAADLSARITEGSRKAIAKNKLRHHQLVAFCELRRSISSPGSSILVHMPFGAGKLRLVATAVLDLYRSESDGKTILWLTPGEALCEEAFSELRNVWEQLGSRDVTIFRLYGDHPTPDFRNLGNCIVVADITKLGHADDGLEELGRRARIIVLGDAERAFHPVGEEIIYKMSKDSTFSLVGILASPSSIIDFSSSGAALRARFSNSYITMNDDDPCKLLRESGDVDEVVAEVQDIKSGVAPFVGCNVLDFSFEYIDLLSKDVERNCALLELLISEARTSGRVLFFATTAEHARLFLGLLALRGVRAMSLTSEKTPEERTILMQKFNARDEKILCVHGFFVSGDSVPELSVAVIATPSLSTSVFLGMVGRLASGRGTDKNRLRLVVVSDSNPEQRRLVETLGTWNKLDI
ncbi:DEAD/DEAH box helicase [Pseudomonas aeruginosa]|uniref:DEAD/DEAH box helicase n=1 Tax=Pseudomonas aeruginosa TaxID=287 RepID=UPI0013CE325B|nr:helicase-related protein [Pseudomonas aeruginosa]HCF0211499.1 hypothetical protein [Pseudomonas aeruginosa]